MAYGGLQMFMGDLKQIINCNDIPLFNNNPSILYERPQFQLLYQELDSIVQTLSNIHQHHHHELERVRNLKKRFKDVVEEAQDTIDLYLSAVTVDFSDSELSPTSDVFKTSLDLKNVMKSIESIKVEVTMIMKMDLSPRINSLKTHSARDAAGTSTSNTRSSPLGKLKPSMAEEIVVGLHRDAEIIRDKLTEDTKQLCVVSIVGMGGQGKTTLATKLFNDPFIKYHFHIRAWATISQTYVRRDLLMQILGFQEDLEKDPDSKLREKLHKKLMGQRYLIVIDDIWSIEAWDALRVFFPNENTGSRILLTSRINEVALHVKPHGFVHSLPCLTEEESWELLKQKVFHGDECPVWLIKPGMQIAKRCHGLPLSVVVMAGILAKESMNKDLWEEIACNVSSYIVSDQKGGCLETLALSYHHLPSHLRECFLYLGGFPESFSINVRRVIRLWVAEGFIVESGNQSLEDTAKAYLMDLINRNLVIVAKRNITGDVKACKLHDLVRELCVQKAKEGFFLKIDSPTSSSQLLESITYEQRRIFTNQNLNTLKIPHFVTQTIRTLLCFPGREYSLKSIQHSFVLLRVLDLQKCRLHFFPQGLGLLVHLRYLAIQYSCEFPNSICKLWRLQTLILKTIYFGSIYLPSNITDLVNLRHLWGKSGIYLPYIEKPMNLYSISKVLFTDDWVCNLQKCFPNIKKLVLYCGLHFHKSSKYLELLPYLENLKLMGPGLPSGAFPVTLKKLSLISGKLSWRHMSVIHLLPNLEVLKLQDSVFMGGRQWDACEQQFRQLKLLKLDRLDIKHWKASSTSFPCLKQLSVWRCRYLEEIPLEIGEIATIELIEIFKCSNSVVESVKRIQQEQHDEGNYDLKIIVDGKELSFYSSQHRSSESE
ncbi:hypothetical protein OSB04_018038 [Centaurea solstitialis]|uniref:Uncharacterized protein n=1 Tax=Centaurea solstitialis TaxID=347529 RepID=A0AA38T414_9ASTR|nr:hypothetical protein OSB04_018038 [Centaurea solstitialis]